MRYDIIGDIHGHANKLTRLLGVMGYDFCSSTQTWGHSTRQALFVGDYVDRGPSQLRTLEIVRNMVHEGTAQAVMGNHEFNAIAWFETDPNAPGEHLRKHTERNFHQHQHFLAEVGDGSVEHQQWIDWFYTLPLWIETDWLRAVHACWHPQSMAVVAPMMGAGNTLTRKLVQAASRKGNPEFEAVELLCKGMEVALPEGVVFVDQQGISRTRTRTAWWDSQLRTYAQAALVNAELAAQLPNAVIPLESVVEYDQSKPLFFGHYWMRGTPIILNPKMCCVDYSAAIGEHPLVAYRFDGEDQLSADKLVHSGQYLGRPACTKMGRTQKV